jgi:hypothetical protein
VDGSATTERRIHQSNPKQKLNFFAGRELIEISKIHVFATERKLKSAGLFNSAKQVEASWLQSFDGSYSN